MAQFNIALTPEFEKNLRYYMKQKGFSQKSEAIRQALEESVQRLKAQKKKTDFRSWLGMALKTPLNPKPRFKNEDELWE